MVGYEAKTINLYSVTLWDALKFEILNVQEEDLAVESLKALTLIGAKFADSAEGPLNAYLRPIIKECNEHLEDAPTKQSEAAGRILYSVAMAGQTVADKLVKGILPTLFSLHSSSESLTKRRGLLEVFNQVLKAYADLEDVQPGIDTEAVQSFASEALDAMERALIHAPKAEVSFRLTSLNGLSCLVSVRKALSDAQVDRVVDAVTEIVLHERVEGHGDIRTPAIKALTEMAHSVPHAIRDRSVPAFMVEMPDCPSEKDVPGMVLEAFAQLSTEGQVFDTVAVRLKNKYNAARHQSAPVEYRRALLLALLYAFTFGAPAREDGIVRSSYYTEYAESLVTDVANGHREGSTLEVIGRIVNTLLNPQGVHFQTTVYSKNLDWMTAANNKDNADVSLTPFTLHYYAALRPEVTDAADIVPLLQTQASLALHRESHPAAAGSVLRLITLLLNKFANPKTLEPTLKATNLEVLTLLSQPVSPATANLALAITKALLLQGKTPTLTTTYLETLLAHLPTAPNPLARNFTTLLAPDNLLTKQNHCLISGLYKQKLFAHTLPPLTDAIRTADPEQKPYYLVALSGILRWLPYSILEPRLSSLIAPILQTLDLPAAADGAHEAKPSALTILESTLMHAPEMLEEHTASLVSRLLNCTTSTATDTTINNPWTLRAKALQCLALCPRQLKSEKVMPFRRQVVRRLLVCLDDGRRGVRAEAVRCRGAWLGLGEGEEEED